MKIFNTKIAYFEIIVFFVLLYLFYNFTFQIYTDIQLHVELIKDYCLKNKPFQVNFIYYFLVYFFSFFSTKSSALLLTSAYLLTLATFFKYYITKKILLKEYIPFGIPAISILSFALIFCFSLPLIYFVLEYYYLATFPANVWHNSTTIFVMPFVTLFFWKTIYHWNDYKIKNVLQLTILAIIIVFIKPSYLFVFVMIFPVFSFLKYKISKTFFINLIPVVLASLMILLQHYLIFSSNTGSDSALQFVPFHFFKLISKDANIYFVLFVSVISSLFFPLVFILKNKLVLKKFSIQFSLSGVLVALLISLLVSETGSREFHGNFIWQTIMCVNLLFFACVYELLNLIEKQNFKYRKFYIEIYSFALHVVSGIYYLNHVIQTGSYF